MLNLLAFLLRIYTFVFHLTLSVFLTGIALIAYRSAEPFSVALKLDMLPFDGEVFVRDTLLLGLTGMLCTLTALTRWFKLIFFIWTAVVLYLMMKWFFLGSYIFENQRQTHGALWLTFGALGAFFGAGWSLKTRRRSAIF